MKIGFYAGSFDPFTNGHLHVIKVSSQIFDKIIIGIGVNTTNATVITYSNLSVDAAIENNANFLIRGIRNGMDYDYEENIALINEEISSLDTIYVRAR